MNLLVFLIALGASSVTASIFDTILPSTSPTITKDPRECTTKILESFFDPPMATGQLLEAIHDHGRMIQKDCKSTLIDPMGFTTCTNPVQSQWCQLNTAIPSSVKPDWTSFCSDASSWWASNSADAVEGARYCPSEWFQAMNNMPFGPQFLNDTIAFAGCNALADVTSAATTSEPTSSATEAGATESVPLATTTTNSPNGAFGLVVRAEKWIVASFGLAAIIVNSML